MGRILIGRIPGYHPASTGDLNDLGSEGKGPRASPGPQQEKQLIHVEYLLEFGTVLCTLKVFSHLVLKTML